MSTKAAQLLSLSEDVTDLTASLASKKLTGAMIDLEKYDTKLATNASDASMFCATAAAMSAKLGVIAKELNMPETAARMAKGAKAFLEKGNDEAELASGTHQMVSRIKAYIKNLKRDAEDGDCTQAGRTAMGDLAFVLGAAAEDLGRNRAAKALEAASQAARQGY
jgi:hypothetical protein